MRLRLLSTLSAGAMASVAFVPVSAFALPTCTTLATNPAFGLAGNPTIVQSSPAPTSTVIAAAGSNAAYCRVDFVVSERAGPAFDYAVGEAQRVTLRIGLPLSSADGGTGGVQGAWNGKIRNLGGGSLVGSVGGVTSATNTNYVGSSTDSGHTNAQNPGFGVIQATNQNNLGLINDFFQTSLRLQYQWAKALAKTYFGTPATRNYWDGCSTGGRQGLVLARNYGQDFDGILAGAPHLGHTRVSSSSVWRQWVNKDIAAGTVDGTKLNAATNAAIAACDALDGVTDGLVSDPRACTFSATANICGNPGAPNAPACLNAQEAQAIDMVWNTARNDKGKKVWPSGGRTAAMSMVVGDGCGANAVMCWIKKDMTFDWRTLPLSAWDDIVQEGSNSLSPHLDMHDFALNVAKNNGAKILMWHGGNDPLIPWPATVYHYNKAIDHFGGLANVTPWFRFYLAPGVGHCGGGGGPQPQSLFNVMVDWVENGTVPDRILSQAGSRTRPLCPWPQTAIYNGSGSTDDWNNFTCGGNIDPPAAREFIAKYQHEAE